jgi:hypothetical protein
MSLRTWLSKATTELFRVEVNKKIKPRMILSIFETKKHLRKKIKQHLCHKTDIAITKTVFKYKVLNIN